MAFPILALPLWDWIHGLLTAQQHCEKEDADHFERYVPTSSIRAILQIHSQCFHGPSFPVHFASTASSKSQQSNRGDVSSCVTIKRNSLSHWQSQHLSLVRIISISQLATSHTKDECCLLCKQGATTTSPTSRTRNFFFALRSTTMKPFHPGIKDKSAVSRIFARID